MRPELRDYLERILDILFGVSPNTEFRAAPVAELVTEDIAKLDFEIGYPNTALAVVLEVDLTRGYPHWRRYSFHYYDAVTKESVWRYDNAPTHPGLPHFPDHKHEGPSEFPRPIERVPGIRDIGDKIRRHLDASTR